jgi:hypothetical protein
MSEMTPMEVEENRLRYFLRFSKVSEGALDNVVQCFKDAHAHVLAEKIRAEVTALGMASDGGARHYRDAANLIDPKVIT